MAIYENRMQLNWTLEHGYEANDWYPFRTNGGVIGETVKLLLSEQLNDSKNYCDWDSGIHVSIGVLLTFSIFQHICIHFSTD